MVFYGNVTADFSEVSYRIKATNSGTFVVPPAYAESMYERSVQARSAGGQVDHGGSAREKIDERRRSRAPGGAGCIAGLRCCWRCPPVAASAAARGGRRCRPRCMRATASCCAWRWRPTNSTGCGCRWPRSTRAWRRRCCCTRTAGSTGTPASIRPRWCAPPAPPTAAARGAAPPPSACSWRAACTASRARRPAGKLRQVAAALWLEARYSKRELLEAYLNLAPYGGNIEGVGAASLIYFHKRAQQLTPGRGADAGGDSAEPAQARRRCSRPRIGQARARACWRLWRARHRATADISRAGAGAAQATLPFLAPHLTDRLLREQHGGEVWSGARPARAGHAGAHHRASSSTTTAAQGIANASAMLLDRDSGEVRALVGSAGYFDVAIDGQVNGTEAKRSPGSTLKPFIYGLALDQGLLHPATMLKDTPTAFGPFSPENFDGRFVGPISRAGGAGPQPQRAGGGGGLEAGQPEPVRLPEKRRRHAAGQRTALRPGAGAGRRRSDDGGAGAHVPDAGQPRR